jgi:hypothetical protein
MYFEIGDEKLPPLKELSLLDSNKEFAITPSLWVKILGQYSSKEIIAHFSELIEQAPVPFPYREYKDARTDFQSLCAEQVKWVKGNWEALRTPKDIKAEFRGQPIYLDYISKVGLSVSDQYTQYARMECGHKSSPSPLRQWDRIGFKDKKRPILKILMGLNRERTKASGVYRTAMYDCLRLGRYMASQFKPSCAKAIYDFFGAKRVLDFSAGWGDRLVGFHASTAESYVGIDPNSKLQQSYAAISNFCSTNKKAVVLCSPAENSDLSNMRFDFVFTSPPYFDVERYSEEDTQSWQRYSDIESWLGGFLFPSLKKSWDSLEEGGRIAVNITDVYDNGNYLPICKPMLSFMEGLGATYEGLVGYRVKKRPGENQGSLATGEIFCEPIFIWSKGEAPEPKWEQDNFFGV